MKNIEILFACWPGYLYTLYKAYRMKGGMLQSLIRTAHGILHSTQEPLEMEGIYQWFTHSVWEVVDVRCSSNLS